jgi:hypothetical protein
VTRSIALLLALVALAGCGGGDDVGAPPDRAAEYAGLLEETDGEGRLLVRAGGDACGIWTSREDGARAFRRTGGGFEEISWDAMAPGDQVELWIPGPIAESCPMQGAAEAAVVRR